MGYAGRPVKILKGGLVWWYLAGVSNIFGTNVLESIQAFCPAA
jgi:hypothetical protein